MVDTNLLGSNEKVGYAVSMNKTEKVTNISKMLMEQAILLDL